MNLGKPRRRLTVAQRPSIDLDAAIDELVVDRADDHVETDEVHDREDETVDDRLDR
jgi:hypothetical protein